MDRAAWGIDDGYWDASGQWQAVPEATIEAIAAAMGTDGRDRPPDSSPLWFVRAGHVEFLQGTADLTLEDGTHVRGCLLYTSDAADE